MTGLWFDRLIIVILENTGFNQCSDCEFVKWFAANGTTFTNWFGQQHPSGPNYRTIFSGQPWSPNEYDGVWRPSVLDVVPSVTVSFAGCPADRHNPAKDMQSKQAYFATVSGVLPIDIQTTPIVYLGMDDSNNAHSGPLATANANVMTAISQLDQGVYGSPNRRLFVVTFDEAFGPEYTANHVFTGMAGDGVPAGKTIDSAFSHQDFAAGLFANWNVPYHGCGPLPVVGKPWWDPV